MSPPAPAIVERISNAMSAPSGKQAPTPFAAQPTDTCFTDVRHVTWDGDTVLKIETDAGQQTRSLRFDTSLKPSGDRTWQGFSAAEWELVGGGGRGVGGAALPVGRRPRRRGTAH